jgi:hypothetical protein
MASWRGALDRRSVLRQAQDAFFSAPWDGALRQAQDAFFSAPWDGALRQAQDAPLMSRPNVVGPLPAVGDKEHR